VEDAGSAHTLHDLVQLRLPAPALRFLGVRRDFQTLSPLYGAAAHTWKASHHVSSTKGVLRCRTVNIEL
jgi:hypothetical protein